MDNERLLKLVIEEKDNVKLRYKQKLNAIKQHYGVEFDVEHYHNENVKSIKFTNLKYKNGFDNLSVIYNAITKKIDYIDYDFTESRIIKNTNHRKFISSLEKDYKLKLIVSEIDRANSEYLKEINEIDISYQNAKDSLVANDKVLQINRKEEN